MSISPLRNADQPRDVVVDQRARAMRSTGGCTPQYRSLRSSSTGCPAAHLSGDLQPVRPGPEQQPGRLVELLGLELRVEVLRHAPASWPARLEDSKYGSLNVNATSLAPVFSTFAIFRSTPAAAARFTFGFMISSKVKTMSSAVSGSPSEKLNLDRCCIWKVIV